jgi:hypothetical protein
MRFATLVGREKSDMKYIGTLEREVLIRVNLPPLDKYIIFQLANRRSIFLTTPLQIDLAFRRTPTEDQNTSKAKKKPAM